MGVAVSRIGHPVPWMWGWGRLDSWKEEEMGLAAIGLGLVGEMERTRIWLL
jgi:hypothetical protein